MNIDTGAIAQFENEEDAINAGHTLQLTQEQARMLLAMTRKDRTRWAERAVRTSNLEVARDSGTEGAEVPSDD